MSIKDWFWPFVTDADRSASAEEPDPRYPVDVIAEEEIAEEYTD
jgi:hypothetical protein